jgi:hypothetical protein
MTKKGRPQFIKPEMAQEIISHFNKTSAQNTPPDSAYGNDLINVILPFLTPKSKITLVKELAKEAVLVENKEPDLIK